MTVISEIPPEQQVPAQETAQDVSDGEEKGHSRGEKKARKALSKLGLKLESDITRVTFKRAKNVKFFLLISSQSLQLKNLMSTNLPLQMLGLFLVKQRWKIWLVQIIKHSK